MVIEQGGLVNGPGSTFTVTFRFNPASALPVGTRVWVRIHGTAYDGDEDSDGLVNEDPPGANNWDDDKDGRIDEDPAGDANGIITTTMTLTGETMKTSIVRDQPMTMAMGVWTKTEIQPLLTTGSLLSLASLVSSKSP